MAGNTRGGWCQRLALTHAMNGDVCEIKEHDATELNLKNKTGPSAMFEA